MGDEIQQQPDAPPPPPAPPIPQTEQPSWMPWLGSTRFWIIAGVLTFAALIGLWVWFDHIVKPDAIVPVVSLSGPTEANKGETAHYAVLVRDRYGAPIKGTHVRVGFFKTHLIELGHATTGDGGDASVEIHFPSDFEEARALVALADGDAEGSDAMTVTPRAVAHGSIFTSTDKPIYQPGQTVHIRSLLMASQKPLADKPTVLEVATWDGVKVFRKELKTSAFGLISADFVLADQVKLGSYSIRVSATIKEREEKPDANSSTGKTISEAIVANGQQPFEVKHYSLPKLKLALEEVSLFKQGAPVTGTARATWIFGEPVTRGKIRVNLMRAGQQVSFGTGTPDKDGLVHFTLDTPELTALTAMQYGLKLNAHVDVEGGMSADADKDLVSIGAMSVKVEAFPEAGVLVPGVTQNVYVVTTHEQKAGISVHASHPQQANATGSTPPPKNGPSATTNERGIAVLSVHPEPKDTLAVQVVAFAENGAEGKVNVDINNQTLVVRPDHSSYNPGDTVNVTVLGGDAGDHISIRMTKAAEPIATASCAVTSRDAGCTSVLTVPQGITGLAWVHAMSLPTARDPGAVKPTESHPVRTGKRMVSLGGGARDLALRITPDKKVYAPRDQGVIDVAVMGLEGAPVKAQLGVAVADEAVFALTNVRPDLEKIFFTINEDLSAARGDSGYSFRGYGYQPSSSYAVPERNLPNNYEPANAYDKTTPTDVKDVVLAALSTMQGTGGFQNADSNSIVTRADQAITRQQKKIGGYTIIFITLLTLLVFSLFGLYGWARFRRPEPLYSAERDPISYMLETRSFMVDWFVAVLGPPVLASASAAATEFTNGGSGRFPGPWIVCGPLCAWLLLRGVRRIRRSEVLRDAVTLKRVLFLLPLATFLGHLAIVLIVADDGRRISLIFGEQKDTLFLALAIALFTQIAFGLLTVIRRSLYRHTTRRQRIWLLLSRASLLGLPITLIVFVIATVGAIKTRTGIRWDEYLMSSREAEDDAVNADQKEGGTGTRAKGEEGSMGNPRTASVSSRYGVRGPSANNTNDMPDAPTSDHTIVVRDYFPETLLWAPDVLTDDQGHASIKVPFADSITTWRFALKAVSQAGQLGSATVPLVVKQDFFVDASLPPILTQGDEIAVPVTVFSYMDTAQDVALEFESDGVSIIGGGASRTALHLGPREARGYRFTIHADKAGERAVKIKAISATHGDAIEKKISITPNGAAVIRPMNARVNGSATSYVEFPKNAIDGGNDLYIKTYGGPLSQVAEGLDGIFHMPYGCFEQTSSTTYPSILALDFLKRTKGTNPEIEAKARDYINQGYQRLVTFEVQSTGGFSIFGKSPASTILTAYGLMEFADMARVASVDPQLIDRTRAWLYGKVSKAGGYARPSREVDDKGNPKDETDGKDDPLVTAFVAWALATSSLKPEEDMQLKNILDAVMRAPLPEGDDPYALALRANALLAGHRSVDAKALLDRLAPQAIHSDDGVHFQTRASGVMYSYGASLEIEATALATHAFALASEQTELRAGALDWLVARRDSYGTWLTTQATIAAMRALIDEAHPAPRDPQDITVLVDGEASETFKLEPKGRDVHHLTGLRKFATTGKHVIEVRATGAGDVSYQVVAKHYLPWQKALGAGLSLDVSYAPTAIVAGEVTKAHARLTWKGKEAARMPLIEIGIPPAFEVDSAALDKLLSSGSVIQRYSVDVGKVTLYLVSLDEKRPFDVDLTLRALRPAKVIAPASKAYLYYEPEVRSETSPVLLRAQ